MKFKNIVKLGFVITVLFVIGSGCKKQDFSNTDPDNVTSATVDYRTVLPSGITNTATAIEGTNFKFLQNWMGYWARSGSYQDLTNEESYSFTNDFNVGVWNSLYANATNYDFVVNQAKAAGGGFYEAIARIMKSLDMQMLVDVYGDVPYSQAFLGAANRTPKYDKAEDIYDSLFVDIDRAITLLKDPIAIDPDKNRNLSGATGNDLIYHGDATSWIKFANTLKLRMLIHAFQVSDFDIAGKMAIIQAEGTGFLQAGESAILNPGYTTTKPAPFYRAYVFDETGVAAPLSGQERANAYSVGPNPGAPQSLGYYQYNGDPRLDQLYTAPPTTGMQRGIPYGEIAGTNSGNTGDKLSTIDGIGYVPDGAASRAWIFTDFESLFLQSEAVERGIMPAGAASAKDLLNSGIEQSFIFLGLTAVDADTYISGNATYPDVDYDGVSQGPGLPVGGIFTILSQKWFALNGFNALESWTDWRRTDFPLGSGAGYLPGPPLSVNPARPAGLGIPIRLYYPQNEYNYNPNSVAAEGTINVTQSATPQTGRIFWDIN